MGDNDDIEVSTVEHKQQIFILYHNAEMLDAVVLRKRGHTLELVLRY